jgi:phosphoglycolate phosphatase-like HAD superfamily hydrolase
MPELLALDFDGVLCDSARETAMTAWRAGRSIWPEWQGEAPLELVERFGTLRPWLETGYQAIPIMRMAWEGLTATQLAVDYESHQQRIVAASQRSREELVGLFGATRDAWIRDDLAGWLGANRFFPGTVAALARALADGVPTTIVTTKQERFVMALLKGVGIDFPADRLYGLERGVSKETVLRQLLDAHAGRVHFVEDRYETLARVITQPHLAEVQLYLATWGYCTPADLAAARDNRRVTCWRPEQFLQLNPAG